MYNRAASQVVTFAPDGSDPRWLGVSGPVAGLTYSFALPGGPAQLTGALGVRPASRQAALEPGRMCQVYRGGVCCWDGQMDEPVPGDSGWAFSAHGSGTFGNQYMSEYADYSVKGQPVTRAIANRGLRWVAPGSWPSDLYMGQPPDSGSVSITDYLNTVCGNAGYTWQVTCPGNLLSVFTPPSVPSRLLVTATPAGRTLAGYYTRLWIRYCSAADNKTNGNPATYALTSVTNSAQAAKHGALELFADLSADSPMNASAAQSVGSKLMAKYTAASFAGPFTARPGQLRTTGGAPVDLGAEQAGTCVQLLLAGGGYGGEVSPAVPVTFVTGSYEYSEDTQLATITPWQSPASDLAGLLSTWATAHTPKTTV